MVEISDVRVALNEIDAEQIPDDTISQKIQQAELSVDGKIAEKYKDSPERDYAVTQMAAYYAFTASPPMTQKSAIDVSSSWDINTFIEELEKRKDRAIQEVGAGEGGSSAAFTESTDGIL